MPNSGDAQPRWTRDYIFDALRELGIHKIFGVPGTNEIPIIDGTSYPENDTVYIECLHENIAMGAAMGSARMTGKPGIVVVHVTPGIGHSIGNLFNASRSRVPLVIFCCQQQNDLVTQEPLLASNLVDLARQFTKWAHEVRTPNELPLVLQRAFKEAMAPPCGPVFLSIPWEFTMRSIEAEDRLRGITQISSGFAGDPLAIAAAAELLTNATNPLIVCGDAVGYASAWPEVQELAALLGAPVVLQSFSSLANFPNDDVHWQGELPGSQAGVQSVFRQHDVAFLCGYGAQAQVAVFKHSDGPLIPTSVRQVHLSDDTWDIGKNYYAEVGILGGVKATLPMLNNLIRKNPPLAAEERNQELQRLDEQRRKAWTGYLDKAKAQEDIWTVVIADQLRQVIEEHGLQKKFVYVHEAVSDPAPFQYLLPLGTQGAAPVSYYCVAGGSLGWSMPASLGIKLEASAHQGVETTLVINAVGDGSSLFYPQVWWTAAHLRLPVLYIITNNHEYHTLQVGLQQVVAAYGSEPDYNWKPKSLDPDYLRIERPKMDLVALANAFGGHDGEVVRKSSAVGAAIRRGVEAVLTGKKSYVLDMRLGQDAPPPPTTPPSKAAMVEERYSAQPRINFYHATRRAGAGAMVEFVSTDATPDLPLIF